MPVVDHAPLVAGAAGWIARAVPSRQAHRHGCRALLALALLVSAGCGSPFSDDQVGNGEKLVSSDLYAVVVPEAAEQTGTGDDISVAWPATGGRVTATVEQEDATVLHEAGDLTRTATTVAGVGAERLDGDLRGVTASEPGDRIRYRVAVHRLPVPSTGRPTEIELELTAPPSLTDAEVQAFRDSAQRFLDRVQVRGH